MSRAYLTGIRWFVAFLVVLAIHTLLAMTLLSVWSPTPPMVNGATNIVMIEFAPMAETSGQDVNSLPSGQKASDNMDDSTVENIEPPKVETEIIEAPKPKVVVAVKEKQNPKPHLTPKVTPSVKPNKIKPMAEPVEKRVVDKSVQADGANTIATSNGVVGGGSGKLSSRNAGPVNSRGVSNALVNWRGLLQGHLAKYKRYPREASRRRHEGVVQVGFSIDPQGSITNSKVFKSSGSVFLDKEAIALLKRASPLPKPPAMLMGDKASISLVFPIDFNLSELR